MSELIVVGDRVLIQPQTGEQETSSGLLLPASVAEQENVRGGRVVKTGPGYLMPNPEYSESETWKQSEAPVRYLPLQAEPGDYAFFMRDEAIQLKYDDTRYLIVQHAAILALLRGDDAPDEPGDSGDKPDEGLSNTTLDDLDL